MSTLLTSKLSEQLKATRDPDKAKAYLAEYLALEYTFADATATLNIPASVAEPVYLIGVMNLITAAFSGGTVTVDVGDGTTVGKYIANSAVTEGTVGDKISAAVGAKLTANAKVVVTIGAGNTAGAGALFVHVYRPAL